MIPASIIMIEVLLIQWKDSKYVSLARSIDFKGRLWAKRIRETPFPPNVERYIDFSELQWQVFPKKTPNKTFLLQMPNKTGSELQMPNKTRSELQRASSSRISAIPATPLLWDLKREGGREEGEEGGGVGRNRLGFTAAPGSGLCQLLPQLDSEKGHTLGVTLHKCPSSGGGWCRCWTWLKRQQCHSCRFQGQRHPFWKARIWSVTKSSSTEKTKKNQKTPNNKKTPQNIFFN